MASYDRQKDLTSMKGSKSLPKKIVRSLKGKPKFIESSGTPMKVYLRVRPYTNNEISLGESQSCLEIENSSSVIMHPPKDSLTFKNCRSGCKSATIHRFDFSHVFGPETDQRSFFQDTTLGVVKDFIRGQNSLVFSYGVTNAGKTYTIHGTSEDLGILPRTFHLLFGSSQDRIYKRTNLKPKTFSDIMKLGNAQESKEDSKKKTLLSTLDDHMNPSGSLEKLLILSTEEDAEEPYQDSTAIEDLNVFGLNIQDYVRFAFWISFAEIYNEQMFDLLEPMSSEKEKKRPTLKLGDDKNGNPYIKGLRHVLVTSAEEALKVLKIGQRNQSNASTRLNNNSSRSHCIFTLKLAKLNVRDGEAQVVQVSQLSFVDLAGSERSAKSQTTGERLKEAGNINTSIMTLGKCVEILRYNQSHTTNPKNVPFRESKLTRLFQAFFCGQGTVSMIVNISPSASAFDETLHALKFSAVARKVATISLPSYTEEKLPNFEVEQLRSIIQTLQSKLIDEVMKTATLELNIREEVSQEFCEHMSEIENNYSKRFMEEQIMNEEVYEKRFELLTNSVRKMRRRQRRPCTEVFEDGEEEDEWVSSVQLNREQLKVKEKDQIIQCLKETIEKQRNIIDDLRLQCVNPGILEASSENHLQQSLDDVLLFSPVTPTMSFNESDDEDCPKSNKRKILNKLGGLIDSGNSISRSAKKLKNRVFHSTNPSSPECTSLKKGKKLEETGSTLS